MEKILIWFRTEELFNTDNYNYDVELVDKPKDEVLQIFLHNWQKEKGVVILEAYTVTAIHEIYGNRHEISSVVSKYL